ncbi:1 TM domain-containing transmembrane protein [Acrasis kona]|uniref:1 TM domain-containing transmembrane protein n=1 Tax=Acrasis kona TaxID=1008807 RepID=A0AAW2ZD83_9EUKA
MSSNNNNLPIVIGSIIGGTLIGYALSRSLSKQPEPVVMIKEDEALINKLSLAKIENEELRKRILLLQNAATTISDNNDQLEKEEVDLLELIKKNEDEKRQLEEQLRREFALKEESLEIEQRKQIESLMEQLNAETRQKKDSIRKVASLELQLAAKTITTPSDDQEQITLDSVVNIKKKNPRRKKKQDDLEKSTENVQLVESQDGTQEGATVEKKNPRRRKKQDDLEKSTENVQLVDSPKLEDSTQETQGETAEKKKKSYSNRGGRGRRGGKATVAGGTLVNSQYLTNSITE